MARGTGPHWKLFQSFTGKGDGSIELRGCWDSPSDCPAIPPASQSSIRISEAFESTDLRCLKQFPYVTELNVSSYRLKDLDGIHHLPRLKILRVARVWPKHISLDFAKLRRLESLSVGWTKGLRNQNHLVRLKQLQIPTCSGVNTLDLSGLKSLKKLFIGPANGIKTLCLEHIPSLEKLALVLMPRLSSVIGEELLTTVTDLDIRGTNSLPKKFLGGFRALKKVDVGMKSKIDERAFPSCNPTLLRFPV